MWAVSQVFTVIFVAANLLVSIPVFSVIVRYNLVNAGIMPLWAANVVSIGTPWALSLVFYAGNQLTELLNWSSALLFVLVNIVLPLALYLRSPAAAADKAAAVTAAPKVHDDGITPIYGHAPVSWSTFMPIAPASVERGGGAPTDADTSMAASEATGLSDALLFSAPLPSGSRSLQAGAPVVDSWDADAAPGTYPPIAEDINAVPGVVRRCVSQHTYAIVTLVVAAAVGIAALGLQGWQEWLNDTGNS